jgi:hypothetical protein
MTRSLLSDANTLDDGVGVEPMQLVAERTPTPGVLACSEWP